MHVCFLLLLIVFRKSIFGRVSKGVSGSFFYEVLFCWLVISIVDCSVPALSKALFSSPSPTLYAQLERFPNPVRILGMIIVVAIGRMRMDQYGQCPACLLFQKDSHLVPLVPILVVTKIGFPHGTRMRSYRLIFGLVKIHPRKFLSHGPFLLLLRVVVTAVIGIIVIHVHIIRIPFFQCKRQTPFLVRQIIIIIIGVWLLFLLRNNLTTSRELFY